MPGPGRPTDDTHTHDDRSGPMTQGYDVDGSKEVAMTSTTSNTTPSNPVQDAIRAGVRDLSAVWWWFLSLGVLWTLFGAYVLSYRVGSLAAVAALAGVALLFGGFTQLAVATRVQSWRWLFIVAGILAVAAGILTLAGRPSPCTWCRS